jgi:hypothetical protein
MRLSAACLTLLLVLSLSVVSMVHLQPIAAAASAQVNDYYPLAIGSKWAYRVVASSQGNTVEKTMEVRIVSKENAGTGECYMREYTMDGQIVQRECYAWQGSKLLLYKATIDGSFADPEPPQLQLESPSEIGHRWDWSGIIGGSEHWTLSGEVVGQTSVAVPAGTFESYQVELVVRGQGQTATFSRWFAEGVGMVKQTETITYGGALIDFSNELTSYAIAGGGKSSSTQLPLLFAGVLVVLVVAAAIVVILKRRSRSIN